MRLAVYFADNDFVNTLLPFFQYLQESLGDFESEEATKESIRLFILECLPAFYLLRQECSLTVGMSNLLTLKGYFEQTLRVGNIYLGDEVDEFLKDQSTNGGSEVYVIYDDSAYVV